MDYSYNKNLFREFLSYPERSDLRLFEDKKRLDKLELLIMSYIDNYGFGFLLTEYKEITKNWIPISKNNAWSNLHRFVRESDLNSLNGGN